MRSFISKVVCLLALSVAVRAGGGLYITSPSAGASGGVSDPSGAFVGGRLVDLSAFSDMLTGAIAVSPLAHQVNNVVRNNLLLTYYRLTAISAGELAWVDGYLSTFSVRDEDQSDSSGVVFDPVDKSLSNVVRPIGLRIGDVGLPIAQTYTAPRVNAQDIDGGFSVSIWIKPSRYDLAWESQIFDFGSSIAIIGLMGPMCGSNYKKIQVSWNDGSSWYMSREDSVFASLPEIPLDTWSHVVVTWDGTDLYIYINGTAYGPANPSVFPASEGSTPEGSVGKNRVAFGFPNAIVSDPDTLEPNRDRSFEGEIAAPCLFGSAISSLDVAALYAAAGDITAALIGTLGGNPLWAFSFKEGSLVSVIANPISGSFTTLSRGCLLDSSPCSVGPGSSTVNATAYVTSDTYELLTSTTELRGTAFIRTVDGTSGMSLELSTDDGITWETPTLSPVSDDPLFGFTLYEGSTAVASGVDLKQRFTFPTAGGFLRGWSRQAK